MTKAIRSPFRPDDDLLLWGAFWIVVGFMLTVTITGCGDEVEAAVHAGVHQRECPNACEDKNPCTEDRCTVSGCVHDPLNGAACAEPGLASGTCWEAECICIDAAGCDDGKACTVDSCNGGRCEHEETACGN